MSIDTQKLREYAGKLELKNVDAALILIGAADIIEALEGQVAEYARLLEKQGAEAGARIDAQAAETERLKKALRVAVLALAHATQEHGKVYEPAYAAVDAALSGEGK